MNQAGESRRGALWIFALGAIGVAVVVRNLVGLDAAPPGMYVDEASIGYNAWAIAHYGLDEHGFHLPLYFQAFGEFKNPLYIYSLAGFLRVLPLTPATERLPAALFGLVAILFIALAAGRLSRSRAVLPFMLVLAALTPWLTQESRVGFEVISMVATLSVALWCLADDARPSPRRFTLAGVFLALSIVGYSTGRLAVALFAVAFVLAYGRSRRRGWWLTLVPVAVAYLLVGVWALLHPGALTAEFSVINIGVDGASPLTVAWRFITNYARYFSPDFLFIHGDPNFRHNTGYTGMLLAVTAPLLVLGLWVCVRSRQPLARFLLFCLVLAPVSASLTNTGETGHALRDAVMLPFLLLLAAFGFIQVLRFARHRNVVPALLAAALFAQGALVTLDMYTAYPPRSAAAFDAGAVQAIAATGRVAPGQTEYVSASLDEEPYSDVFAALLPPPPESPTADSEHRGLRLLGVVVAAAGIAEGEAQRGDILVLTDRDPRPTIGVQLIDAERAPVSPLAPPAPGRPLVLVYRVT